MKGRKCFGSLTLGIVLALGLAACGQGPEMTTYWMEDRLEIVSEGHIGRTSDGAWLESNLVQIKGLRDTALELRINGQIKETAEGLLTAQLPAYRGIKRWITAEAKLVGQRLDTAVCGQFNSILSVEIQREARYWLPKEQETRSVGQVKTLNFDLNTGEQITLAQLFPPGTDYLALLDGQVRRELAEGPVAEESGWIAPFSGVRPEQPFTISPAHLTLYWDESTPECLLDFAPSVIWLDNQELRSQTSLATGFYQPGRELFSEEAQPHLFSAYLGSDIVWERVEEHNDWSVPVRVSYSSQLPPKAQQAVRDWAVVDETQLATVMAAAAKNGSPGSYWVKVSVYQLGDYFILSRLERGDDGAFDHSRRYEQTLDRTTGEPVTLAQLFQPGFDYLAVLREALDAAECSDDALTALPWSLGETGLRLELPGPEEVTVPYNQFGMDNMTIFH